MNEETKPTELVCIRCGSKNILKYDYETMPTAMCRCKDCNKSFTVAAFDEYQTIRQLNIVCSNCDAENIEVRHDHRHIFETFCPRCNSRDKLHRRELLATAKKTSVASPTDDKIVVSEGNPVDSHPVKHNCLRRKPPVAQEVVDADLLRVNRRLKKVVQHRDDRNRELRKSEREEFRQENRVELLEKTLKDIFAKFDFSVHNHRYEHPAVAENKGISAIIQLSDIHFNEIVQGMYSNSYDFEVASKRLRLFAQRSITMCRAHGITNVVVAMTGDMVNAAERPDKRVNMEYSRIFAAVAGAHLIQQFIHDLLGSGLKVTFTSVVGNESRLVDKDFGYSTKIVSDSLDLCIHQFLKLAFADVANVTVIDGQFDEKVISVQGLNFLLCHKVGEKQKEIMSMIGKYSLMGITVDHIISGHIHYTNIGDLAFRSASMSGGNNYTNNGLNLSGRAGQNIYIVRPTGVDPMKIDLQDVSDVVGYSLDNNMVKSFSAKEVDRDEIVITI